VRVIVYGLSTPGNRRAEYKRKTRSGAWTSTGRQFCTSRAVRSVIQSYAQRPPPYRRAVLDFWCHLWLPSYGAPPKDVQIAVIFCTRVHYSRSVFQARKWRSWSESALPRGQRRLGSLLPSTGPRRIPPSTITSTPGNAGSVGLIGRHYPGSLGRLRLHFGRGDLRGIHWFCQASTPKGQPGDWKKASLIYREPSRSGIATRPNDSSTSGHSFGEVAPNKTLTLCGRCGNVGPVLGTVRVVHRQGPYLVYGE